MNIEPSFPITKASELQRGFYKNWYVKLNDPRSQQALWLRFSVLCSNNGFKKIAEVWAIFFQKVNKEVKKVALKQTHSLQAFLASEQSSIRIGDCELSPEHTRGSIYSQGNSIQWDLIFVSSKQKPIRFVPNILSKTRIIKNSVMTMCEELLCTGTTQINGERIEWTETSGMQGYLDGSKNNHSWIWGHCNSFVNEQGKPTAVTFEGISTRAQIGPLVIPKLSSFYFYYQDQPYHFNTLRDAISIKSKNTLNEWTFQADRDELSFRGKARSEHKGFAGLTFEDTNGSLLYCTHSELADMKIHIYRKDKLELTLIASATAGLEIVSRHKNPYVPTLI